MSSGTYTLVHYVIILSLITLFSILFGLALAEDIGGVGISIMIVFGIFQVLYKIYNKLILHKFQDSYINNYRKKILLELNDTEHVSDVKNIKIIGKYNNLYVGELIVLSGDNEFVFFVTLSELKSNKSYLSSNSIRFLHCFDQFKFGKCTDTDYKITSFMSDKYYITAYHDSYSCREMEEIYVNTSC